MPDRSTTGTQTNNADSFKTFLEGWMVRQEHYLDELLSAQQHCHDMQDEDIKELCSRMLAHYQEYYEAKSRIAQRDVFLAFSPTWLTSFERTFLWIAGFKPGIVFRIVTNSVLDMSEDQTQRMNRLLEETKLEERALNDELAKVHESVAGPTMLEAARRSGRLVGGEASEEETATATLRVALESVVANADSLRMRTAMKVVEILRPAQKVRFLAGAAQLQLRIRSWGLQRQEDERQESTIK
ncbi:protein DOG1-like 4 [Quercus lobata]|uniref:DOG1 domain-containing protein n=1 Tax=Quercus lobata TaxID=97700 RepID=A0A7N2M5X8_QUELO|nr:protein DOG1-like 4 [Quercus lobata]